MSLDLSVRQGYAVEVIQVDESNLVMTVLVANPDGKASGRHIFNLKTGDQDGHHQVRFIDLDHFDGIALAD